MTSWKIERDRLVAQTLAFVQGVEKARPIAAGATMADLKQKAECHGQPIDASQPKASGPRQDAAELTEIGSGRAASPPDQTALLQRTPALAESKADCPVPGPDLTPDVQPAASPKSPAAAAIAPLKNGTAAAPLQIPLNAASERDDILQRVASFRARQSRFSRERQIYYESVQAKIRTTLGNDSGGTPL